MDQVKELRRRLAAVQLQQSQLLGQLQQVAESAKSAAAAVTEFGVTNLQTAQAKKLELEQSYQALHTEVDNKLTELEGGSNVPRC
jgi:hypothetical protein